MHEWLHIQQLVKFAFVTCQQHSLVPAVFMYILFVHKILAITYIAKHICNITPATFLNASRNLNILVTAQ